MTGEIIGYCEMPPQVVPRVEISEILLAEDVPYQVSANSEKYGQFLRHCGVGEDLISQHVLSLEGGGRSTIGEYFSNENRTTIYMHTVWNHYNSAMKAI